MCCLQTTGFSSHSAGNQCKSPFGLVVDDSRSLQISSGE